MSHPFGDLLAQALHRKHGLSQSKLAAGILQSPSIITDMSQGKRLNGPQARQRVTAIIDWLQQQGALETVAQANALLEAAGMTALRASEPLERILLQQLRLSPVPSLPDAVAPARPTNLPIPLTSFVGRIQELTGIPQLVATQRLVTLTGAGGVGKTRLALEVGKRLLTSPALPHGEFRDGVWFVELAALAAPSGHPDMDTMLVAQTIARLFNRPEQAGHTTLETLEEYLADKHLLLILDNCEHLVTACAKISERLLQRCWQLHVLATSREELRIPGEVLYPVPPLALPSFTEHAPELVLACASAQLFVERMRAISSGQQMQDAELASLAHICRQLDGIPLALELAASLTRSLSLIEIATQLDNQMALLTNNYRTAIPRHQTMRNAMDWSYQLLSSEEQNFLARASVFAGGWTLEAAQAVCVDSVSSDFTPANVAILLNQLSAKSLVLTETLNDRRRYRLLEPVRQFAHAQLVASGCYELLEPLRQFACAKLDEAEPAAAAQQRHLRYYMTLAEEIEPHLRNGQQLAQRYAQLEAEHDNLRAAINWALCSGEFTCGLRIVGALYDFWLARGYLQEGQAQAERLLAHTEAAPTVERAQALLTAGGLAANQHQYHIAQPLLLESEAIARELGSAGHLTLARTCIELSWTMLAFLDFALAQRYGQEGLALGQALDEPWVRGQALIVLGAVASEQGDYATARQHLEAALACAQPLGCTLVYGSALSNLGKLLGSLGDYQSAHAYLTQSVAIFDALGGRLEKAWSLLGLGDIAAAQVNVAEAEQYYDQALTIQRELNNYGQVGDTLMALGRVAQHQGDDERSRVLRQESLVMAIKAEQYYDQALAIQRELNDDDHAGATLAAIGRLAQRQGDYERSRELLRESLVIAIKMGYQPAIADTLEALAALSAAQGQAERAVLIFGAVDELLRKNNTFLNPIHQPLHDCRVSELHNQLGAAAFTATWAAGAAMPLAEVTALILND